MSASNTTLLNQPGTYTPPLSTSGYGSTTSITINPSGYGYGGTSSPYTISTSPYNFVFANPIVSYPSQSVIVKIGEGSEKDEVTLITRFNDIVDDELHFLPYIDGKKVEPLETIMKYIKSQKKMDLKLTRVGYEIQLKGVVLKNIKNLLSKNSDTLLKVTFEYDELIYDNTLLTLEEKRSIKVREIAKNLKKNDI